MNVFRTADTDAGLCESEIRAALDEAIAGRKIRKALIIPPDYTRFHSNAGFITVHYYNTLKAKGAQVDILPALGTHAPMSDVQLDSMYPGIPHDRFFVHRWREDVVKVGEIPADFVSDVSEGLWTDPVYAEVNKMMLDPSYDIIISVGQVVPHEVIGMSNHSKNIFVGVGGSSMINSSHMIGAVYGMERMMGRDNTPVRRIFDYGLTHFLSELPILFALTVTTAPGGNIHTHGLFLGEGRECLTAAIKLSQEINVDYVSPGLDKCVVYLNPDEFTSTWLGNKSVYRTRMALADNAELIILAPGVDQFGEDPECDRLIRKYGYRGRLHTLEAFKNPENADLRANMSAAAHLIHGSSDGRFNITYAVKPSFMKEIEAVGYKSANVDEMMKAFDPEKLSNGYNDTEYGRVFYIPNPALGLWIDRSRL